MIEPSYAPSFALSTVKTRVQRRISTIPCQQPGSGCALLPNMMPLHHRVLLEFCFYWHILRDFVTLTIGTELYESSIVPGHHEVKVRSQIPVADRGLWRCVVELVFSP